MFKTESTHLRLFLLIRNGITLLLCESTSFNVASVPTYPIS